MTNGEYQRYSISTSPDLLISKLHTVLLAYCESEGVDMEFAMRDALTDLRHISDIHELEFANINKRAYEGYTEEAQFAAEQDIPDSVMAHVDNPRLRSRRAVLQRVICSYRNRTNAAETQVGG